jgi:O-antigen/teichoic acid export membrane protein
MKRSIAQRAFQLNTEGVGRRILSGAAFQVLVIVSRTVITIGSMAVLARLLSPTEFGYVAMATVVTELAALFANFGFANILIQRQRISRLDLDTMFWASLAVGLALTVVVLGLSFVAGAWFDNAKVVQVLRLLAVSFVMGAMITVPWIILSRLMRFRTEFWIQLAALIIRALVAIVMAWWGWGVWSLVGGALAGIAVQALLGLLMVGFMPRLRFNGALIKSTWRTSGSYFGGGVLFYINNNVDLMLVGRTYGPAGLGLYQTARGLSEEIRARIAVPLQNVLFPAFSSVRSDLPAAQRLFLRAAGIITAVVMPVGVMMAALAEELVLVLYGAKWLEMVPLVAVFGLGGALRASTAIANPVINAWNELGRSLRFQIIGTVLTVAAIIAAMPFGLRWVAIAIVTVSFYSFVPYGYALRLLGLPWSRCLQILATPALSAALAWAAVGHSKPAVQAIVASPAAHLVILSALGGLTYLFALLGLGSGYRAEAKAMWLRLIRQRAR